MFWMSFFSVHFQALIKKNKKKVWSKRSTTGDNDNVPFHHHEENKLRSK